MEQDRDRKNRGYPFLFSPLRIGPFQLKNRIVALPVHTGYSYPDGRVSPLMMESYTRLAASGPGMVVVANASVAEDGAVSRFNLRADTDDFLPGLAALAAGIKRNGAIACLQLNHAGRFAKTARPLLPSPITHSNLAFNMESLKRFMEFFPLEKRFGLTRNLVRQLNSWLSAMDSGDYDRVIEAFSHSALRACKAGFDMVELHGANGYLLCQFLSGFTNRLSAGFGGSFEARTRFPLAVLKAVKDRLPRGFPVGYRLILREWVPEGIDFNQARAFARRLEEEGVSYLSASAATYNSLFSASAMETMAKPGYLKREMAILTRQSGVPTIMSGRITSPSMADRFVRERVADLIGLGRPLRADPGWIAKALGKGRKIIPCINCHGCIKRVILEQGFSCTQWPRQIQERIDIEHKLLARNDRSLWVVALPEDMALFKKMIPLFSRDLDTAPAPTLLLLGESDESPASTGQQDRFLKWVSDDIAPAFPADKAPGVIIDTPGRRPEQTVLNHIDNGDFGRVFIANARDRSWPGKLIYSERRKVMGFLRDNDRLQNILVPVDLSPATLMVMMFVQKTFLRNSMFRLTAAHVLTGPASPVEQRWKEIKAVAGVDPMLPLVLLPLKSDISATLGQAIDDGRYGTVVMGKRGLSGIKRWLAGSVSAGVFHGLKDETLFLID